MLKLRAYLKKTSEVNLKKLEKIVKSSVIDSYNNTKIYKIKIRKNPAFSSKARIIPERELRKKEIVTNHIEKLSRKECFLCNPRKRCAKFSENSKLKKQYFLNDSAAFSNLFTTGKIHGIVVYNYKKHITDPRNLKLKNWVDGLKLVQKIGRESGKDYVSTHINCGPKSGASIEHFHGQFHCEDEPLSKTLLSMKLTKKLRKSSREWWKSWVKSMLEEGLVINFDLNSKVVFYVEWSPVFGKAELVIMTLENSSFKSLRNAEIKSVAKFLQKGVRILMDNVSSQFNVVNLSASPKDDFCNQFRIFSRSPISEGLKSWEGYLEFSGETVPHIEPRKLANIAKEYF